MDRAPDIKCVRDDSIRGSETDTFCLTLGRSLDHFFFVVLLLHEIDSLARKASRSEPRPGAICESNRHACFSAVVSDADRQLRDTHRLHATAREICKTDPAGTGNGRSYRAGAGIALGGEEEKYHFTICVSPEQCDSLLWIIILVYGS